MQKVYTKIESIVGNVVTVKAEGVRLGDLALVGDSYATVIKLDRDIVSLQVFALKRVIRALEVYEQTGMTIDEFNRRNKRPEPKYDALKIGVCPSDREILYDRINRRVDLMMENGLLEETKRLVERGLLTGTAAQAIGYKELLGYLSGEQTLEECTELLKRRSRNYAKRQLTWLKRDDSIHWIYYNSGEELPFVLQETTKYLQNHGVQ